MDSETTLRARMAKQIPGALLEWSLLPGSSLEALLLEPESASRPLDPDVVESVMESPPFWGILWPAGRLLCSLLEARPELVASRACVDMGCGSGLVSLALARAEAEVVGVDSDLLSLEVSRLNASRNNLTIEFRRAWEQWSDTLVLADFLYDESHLPMLESFASRSEEILVVDSRLKSLSSDGFHHLGEKAGRAFPDLDPHDEFGLLNVWYKGPRVETWRDALDLIG